MGARRKKKGGKEGKGGGAQKKRCVARTPFWNGRREQIFVPRTEQRSEKGEMLVTKNGATDIPSQREPRLSKQSGRIRHDRREEIQAGQNKAQEQKMAMKEERKKKQEGKRKGMRNERNVKTEKKGKRRREEKQKKEEGKKRQRGNLRRKKRIFKKATEKERKT